MGNEHSLNEYTDKKEQLIKYNYLFHKFILNISDPYEDIHYNLLHNILSLY